MGGVHANDLAVRHLAEVAVSPVAAIEDVAFLFGHRIGPGVRLAKKGEGCLLKARQ